MQTWLVFEANSGMGNWSSSAKSWYLHATDYTMVRNHRSLGIMPCVLGY
jgi:hypothetical protein